MPRLPKPVSFEWDSGNSDKNLLKHNVTIKEAEQVFLNNPFLSKKDDIHFNKEVRYHGLGKTDDNRKLFVCFTIRDKKVRVISIRDMNRKEKKVYEEA